MRYSFCFIEKNKNTFGHIQDYYNAIKRGKPTIVIDSSIQCKEIENFLSENNLTPDDREAINKWIQANSSHIRSYLNSIKMLALYFFISSKSSGKAKIFSFDLFCKIADLWNERKINFIDTVFL